ncbi:solute carrier family 35 member B1-like [Penaeus chinensis]|uniref:solute carrier family 35 member B1-like n=1 Tax=Penaeus chinensis TaxID=139456 RepID=UPI001FB80BBF|nr:solute carrier family 35 member B1-like [Penaeus chinensis]
MTETPQSFFQTAKFFIYASGIFFLYFYYGILQETITRTRYGEEKEKFTYSLALVFCQCIVNAIYAKIMGKFFLDQGEDTTRRVYYASCSLTYLLAMVASNMALQWINYPTQVVGKSCKPIPVMVLGVILGRKSYSWKKYVFIFMIVVGVALFIYKDSKATASTAGSGIGLGEVLLVLSLTMDGLTGAVQERMIAESKTKSGHMMLNMNLFSIGYLAVALLVTGELFTFVAFVQRFPEVMTKMLIFSVCSALGQFFIFLMVSEYGPLPCSIVTTTRKFFTVLGSVIFFGNELSNRQWGGTLLVFSGLTLDAMYGKTPKKEIKDGKASKELLHSHTST